MQHASRTSQLMSIHAKTTIGSEVLRDYTCRAVSPSRKCEQIRHREPGRDEHALESFRAEMHCGDAVLSQPPFKQGPETITKQLRQPLRRNAPTLATLFIASHPTFYFSVIVVMRDCSSKKKKVFFILFFKKTKTIRSAATLPRASRECLSHSCAPPLFSSFDYLWRSAPSLFS